MKTFLLRGFSALIFSSLIFSACTDAPRAPMDAGYLPALLSLQPTFNRALLRSAAATDALADAFDRVDRFRMIVSRLSGEVVVDVIIEVTPGGDSYELSAEVPMQSSTEQFIVDIIALVGSTELFRAENLSVQAVAGEVTETASDDQVEFEYVGPGATATEVSLTPGALVLSPGATAEFTAVVLDELGVVVPDVPLGWESDAPGVVSVDDGMATAVGDGRARLTVVTPGGLRAGADVYVVDGELVFERGGSIYRGPVGGDSSTLLVTGTQPSFSPDGSLYYSSGGRVLRAGGTTVTSGVWPAVSPDGTKIAVESGGNVVVTNIDGTRATTGPQGRGPLWASDVSFIVSGSGLALVDANGDNRTVLVAGSTSRAAFTGGGLAYVQGGSLIVAREDGSAGVVAMIGVSGRPAVSPDGQWAIGAGGPALMIAPADGSGPALPLAHGAAANPVFESSGGGGSPPSVQITGLDPEAPGVGEEVTILGSGFDVVIPANNGITFTTEDPEEGGGVPARAVAQAPIVRVTLEGITTIVPEGVVPGPITVKNFSSTGVFTFDPPLGVITVLVKTKTDVPVGGAVVTLTDSDGKTVTQTSDSDGVATFTELDPSEYTTSIVPPAGFSVIELPDPVQIKFGQTVDLEAFLRPGVVRVEVSPGSPAIVVGSVTEVTVTAFDALGNEVADPPSIVWESLDPAVASISGGGVTGQIRGLQPSSAAGANDARFRVSSDGVSREFSGTVSTFISGVVKDPLSTPVEGVRVALRDGRGSSLGREISAGNGAYRFDGLFRGNFIVEITPPQGFTASPTSHSFALGPAEVAGRGDFVVAAPEPFTLLPEKIEKLPGGTQQFTADGSSGPFDWSVHGVAGGNATFGTITTAGFYTAPDAVPSPATFKVCAALQSNTSQFACSEVTIEPVPTAGEDVVVFNDVNLFDQTSMSNPNNVLMVQNLVNFTSEGDRTDGTRVWLDRGRSSSCGGPCVTTTTMQNTITGQGLTFEFISSTQGSLTSIPSDVKVIILWNAQQTFTVAEINTLKAFAVEGGRIVYVGEWDGFLGANGIAVENQFLTDMGAEMRNVGQAVDCSHNILVGNIVDHQVTTGMTGVTVACASVIVPGVNDFALFFDSSGTKVLAGVAKIDPTPLAGAPARIVMPTTPLVPPMERGLDPAGGPPVRKR